MKERLQEASEEDLREGGCLLCASPLSFLHRRLVSPHGCERDVRFCSLAGAGAGVIHIGRVE